MVGVLVILGVIGALANNNNDSNRPSHNAAAAKPVANGPSTPAGFTTFRSAADEFTIDVPKTWKAVDPSSPGAQAAIDEIEQANPALRSAFASSAAQLAEKGMALLALNPAADTSGFSANVNVLANPDLGFSDSDLSKLAAVFPGEYAKLGGTITSTSFVTLSGQKALRFTGTLALTTPLGTHLRIPQTQYYLSANGFLYVLTLSGRDANMPAIAASFSSN